MSRLREARRTYAIEMLVKAAHSLVQADASGCAAAMLYACNAVIVIGEVGGMDAFDKALEAIASMKSDEELAL